MVKHLWKIKKKNNQLKKKIDYDLKRKKCYICKILKDKCKKICQFEKVF